MSRTEPYLSTALDPNVTHYPALRIRKIHAEQDLGLTPFKDLKKFR